MKKRELQGLIHRISAECPQLVHDDRLLYEIPVNSILRGIAFSTFVRSQRKLRVVSFARPLFVPSPGPLIGEFCTRIRRGILSLRDVWSVDEFERESVFNALVAQIRKRLSRLERLRTPLLFARNAMSVFRGADEDREFAIGLSFLKGADLLSGEKVLRRLSGRASRSSAVRVELIERVNVVLGKIGSPDLDELLNQWEQEAITQLRSYGVRLLGDGRP